MYRNRHFSEERRSKLFTDAPYIWGRLPKFMIAFICCMQFWAGYYLYHKAALNQHLQE